MWQTVWAKNTVKALLPLQGPLRSAKRRISPPKIGPQHESVLDGGRDHIAALRAAGCDPRHKRILELGTGWFPLIPIMLRLAGAERVFLTDAFRLMDEATLRRALEFIEANAARVAGMIDVPVDEVEDVLRTAAQCETFETMLSSLGFIYFAPFDVDRQMPEVDAVVSQTVFEHISPDLLRSLLGGFNAGLRPGGFMSHGIDNTDHRANDDPALDRLDFLRYGEGWWSLLCIDPQSYTNRLRHSDYVDLFEKTGHEVVWQKTYVLKESLPVLAKMALPARFRNKDRDDLATGWSHIVTRRKPAVAA